MDAGLTTQQKSRFRRAYRDTFVSENHGDAVKAMYARFTELYGVPVNVLRAIVTAEWARDPRQYHRLQAQLAARQAASQGQQKPSVAASSSRSKAKPKAKKTQKTRTQKTQKPDKARAQSKGRKLKCPVCRKSVSVADNGCLKGHHGVGVWCRGSGVKVAAPRKSGGGGYFGSGSSIRTVSGGLPGLGRRT